MSFDDFALNNTVKNALKDLGFVKPTAVQEQAIPLVLQGSDVLACAQTGTGKTAAFLLPIINNMQNGQLKMGIPNALILSPTRELALQIADAFDDFAKGSKLRQVCLIGGVSQNLQMAEVRRGVNVIIATPGRLIDFIERGSLLLHQIKYLVIDEADRMLDMGFIPDIEKIMKRLPPRKQTLFFSATMPKPIEKLANKILKNPKTVFVTPPQTSSKNIKQYYIALRSPKNKEKRLSDFLSQEKVNQGMIFCNRKKDIDALCMLVAGFGYSVSPLHGDMTQMKRLQALDSFKAGEIDILICSDVAARGVDVEGVSHVINFEVPGSHEDYVHRIGRTGRAGSKGISLTFVTDREKTAKDSWNKIFENNKDSLEHYGALEDATQSTSGSKDHKKSDQGAGRGKKRNSKHENKDTQSSGNRMPHKRSANGGVKEDVVSNKKTDNTSSKTDDDAFGDDVPAFLKM